MCDDWVLKRESIFFPLVRGQRLRERSSCRSEVAEKTAVDMRKTEVEEDERGLAWLCVVWVRLRE